MSKGKSEKVKKNENKPVDPVKESLAILKAIPPPEDPPKKMQFYEAQTDRFGYAVGSEGYCAYVTNEGLTDMCLSQFTTKFSSELAQRYLGPHATPNGERIWKDLQAVLHKYLWFHDQRMYPMVATWIMGTYLYQIFSFYGYLLLYSKKTDRNKSGARCGKSQFLKLNQYLSYEAKPPMNITTSAAIRDGSAMGQVLQIDTLDKLEAKGDQGVQALMDILDGAFGKGGYSEKKVLDDKGNWKTQSYWIYSPYSMCGIGRDNLEKPAQDRSFIFEMKQKSITIKKAKMDEKRLLDDTTPIRNDLYFWGLHNSKAVAKDYRTNPNLISDFELNDRAEDIWRPLFVVLRNLGFKTHSTEWETLKALAIEMHLNPEVKEREEQLKMFECFRSHDSYKGTTTDMVKYLAERGIERTAKQILVMMEEHSVPKKSLRLKGRKPFKGFELTPKILDDIMDSLTHIYSETDDYNDYRAVGEH